MRNNGWCRAWEESHRVCDGVTLAKSWPDYLPKHGSNSLFQQQSPIQISGFQTAATQTSIQKQTQRPCLKIPQAVDTSLLAKPQKHLIIALKPMPLGFQVGDFKTASLDHAWHLPLCNCTCPLIELEMERVDWQGGWGLGFP